MSAPTSTPPRIWLVIGDKPGDNAQVEIIAEQLDLPYEIKRVLPKPEYVLGKPRFEVSLEHLDLDRSDTLAAPWPDLILTIGRRPSMAALWIQEKSGNHSKVVLLGRPKRWQERFSLIISPAQYQIPPAPNVLQLDLPLMRSSSQKISEATETWRSKFSALPQPLTALLVGGETKPFRFDAKAAKELLKLTKQQTGNGHLYISTSRRTPETVTQALKQHLPPNATLYCWSPETNDNPYFALLGLAEQFIVTGDSVSMMVEVARRQRPLFIYSPPVKQPLRWRVQQSLSRWLMKSGKTARKWLYKLGLIRYSRDLFAFHALLYQQGFAAPLGTKKPTAPVNAPEDEVSKVVHRIRQILET